MLHVDTVEASLQEDTTAVSPETLIASEDNDYEQLLSKFNDLSQKYDELNQKYEKVFETNVTNALKVKELKKELEKAQLLNKIESATRIKLENSQPYSLKQWLS